MRAQAAMEYLMTYGWALLIVVIVGVALWSLGVFNVGSGNVIRLVGVNSMQLVDAADIDNDSFKMVLAPRRAMKDVNITVYNCTKTYTSLKPSDKITIICDINETVSNAMPFTLEYKDPFSDMDHKEEGTLTGLSS